MEPGHRSYTAAEYLALEDDGATKHELIHGERYAIAGASPEHVLITGNVSRALHQGLRLVGRRCLVLQSDQRLHVVATGMFTYPDVTVVCDRPQLHGSDPKSLINPLVLVEVLADSTEKYDRGAKFAHYRAIPSLDEVLLVAQDERSRSRTPPSPARPRCSHGRGRLVGVGSSTIGVSRLVSGSSRSGRRAS